MNYLAMFDSDWLRFCDLDGRPQIATIAKVEAGEIRNKSKRDRRPVVHFREYSKPLALNKTNGKAIATLFTAETTKWVGQRIELFPARTQFGGEEVDCIRVRAANGKATEARPAQEKPEPSEALDDLRALLTQLGWKAQQTKAWFVERYGAQPPDLDKTQLGSAFRLLYTVNDPDKYSVALAAEQAAGMCK